MGVDLRLAKAWSVRISEGDSVVVSVSHWRRGMEIALAKVPADVSDRHDSARYRRNGRPPTVSKLFWMLWEGVSVSAFSLLISG